MHDVAGFQDGYPGFGRVVRNATVIGEGGKIEELPGTTRAQFQEPLKSAQILQLDQLPDIAFQVSAYIIAIPRMWLESMVKDGGNAPSIKYLVELAADFS